MPTAHFLTPYVIEATGLSSSRVPLIGQQFDAQIVAEDGAYAYAEIEGNQALCTVRASAATLADLALAFTPVANPALVWTPTYRTHQLIAGEIVLHASRTHQAKTLSDLAEELLTDIEIDAVKALLAGYVAEIQAGGKVRLPKDLRPALKNELLLRAARAGFGLNRLSTGTFPTQGVLDDFNRADANTLGANWANNTIALFSGTAEDQAIVSNACSFPTPDSAVALHYTDNTFGPDSEAYMTIPTIVTGDSHTTYVRIVQPGTSTFDGYAFTYAPSGTTMRCYRADNGAMTQFAGVTQSMSNGDKMGGDMIGSTGTIYQFTGGAWNTRATGSDSTYTAAGLIGMYCPGTSGAYSHDDFGGGTVLVAGPGVNPTFFDFPKQKLREAKIAGRM